ncbi:conjugal transfer protein MobA [Bacteroides sp.]|uniref:conjugal transfer protein MobA n=1 Tax=Bacteroides sp. TaxID=29523 RepID=UPI002616B444|nr:conjugal transfer protein MobA [Bacteroides sp.]MDD3039943.1 conjugal transfer protein MobA [Bacteroides sp.]
MNRIKNKMGGRPPKTDPANNRISVNLSDIEYADFLTLYEKSGVHSMASFIKARIFNETFRVVKVDGSLLDYTQQLSSFYNQYRAIGVNYNQTVATLKSKFEERKALTMLYKLEQQTVELVQISRQISALSLKFKELWLQKSASADHSQER